jgi:hypothetical protein
VVTAAVTTLLSGSTWFMTVPLVLLVLVVVILCGPERTYQRTLELIRALRGGSGQTDTTPPPQDTEGPPS